MLQVNLETLGKIEVCAAVWARARGKNTQEFYKGRARHFYAVYSNLRREIRKQWAKDNKRARWVDPGFEVLPWEPPYPERDMLPFKQLQSWLRKTFGLELVEKLPLHPEGIDPRRYDRRVDAYLIPAKALFRQVKVAPKIDLEKLGTLYLCKDWFEACKGRRTRDLFRRQKLGLEYVYYCFTDRVYSDTEINRKAWSQFQSFGDLQKYLREAYGVEAVQTWPTTNPAKYSDLFRNV